MDRLKLVRNMLAVIFFTAGLLDPGSSTSLGVPSAFSQQAGTQLPPPNFRVSGIWEFSRRPGASGSTTYLNDTTSGSSVSSNVNGYDSQDIGLPDQEFTSGVSFDGESRILILDMSTNEVVLNAAGVIPPEAVQFLFELDDQFSGQSTRFIGTSSNVTPGCRINQGYWAEGRFSGDPSSDELVLNYFYQFRTLPGEPEPCFEYLVQIQTEVKAGLNTDDFWRFLVDSGAIDPERLDEVDLVEISYVYDAVKKE